MENFCNELFFFLRRKTPRLRRSPYREKAWPRLEQDLIPAAIAETLSESSLRQALFYASLLQRVPIEGKYDRLKLLDLGSKDFVYVSALASFLDRLSQSFEITGLELDPYQIYFNFFKRGDLARYYVEKVSHHFGERAKIDYEDGDWLKFTQPKAYDLITCFFPFLFSDLHFRFHLPKKAFAPELFYKKSFQAAPLVLFFHQGKEELSESKRLILDAGLGEILFEEEVSENFWMPRKHPVEILFVRSKLI
jgi:hypothetical protein